MKIVGHRLEPAITAQPNGDLLAEGARANDELHAFPGGDVAFVPKGLYRFLTHGDANRHWEACLALAMAQLARRRR